MIYDVLGEAQGEAGVQRFGLHGLRHLYASALVNANTPVKHAQERLGHASATTTMEIYAHSITDKGREYAAAVEAAFPGLLPEIVHSFICASPLATCRRASLTARCIRVRADRDRWETNALPDYEPRELLLRKGASNFLLIQIDWAGQIVKCQDRIVFREYGSHEGSTV